MNKSNLTLLTLAILVLLSASGIYAYMYHSVDASSKNIINIKGKIIQSETSESKEAKLANLFEVTSTDWKKLSGAFVPQDQAVEFIESLESIGKQASSTMTISSINQVDPKSLVPGAIGSLDAHIQTSGSWKSIMRSLELTENMPYIVTVDNIHLSKGSDSKDRSNSEWQLDFDVSAKTAVLLPSQPTGK